MRYPKGTIIYDLVSHQVGHTEEYSAYDDIKIVFPDLASTYRYSDQIDTERAVQNFIKIHDDMVVADVGDVVRDGAEEYSVIDRFVVRTNDGTNCLLYGVVSLADAWEGWLFSDQLMILEQKKADNAFNLTIYGGLL